MFCILISCYCQAEQQQVTFPKPSETCKNCHFWSFFVFYSSPEQWYWGQCHEGPDFCGWVDTFSPLECPTVTEGLNSGLDLFKPDVHKSSAHAAEAAEAGWMEGVSERGQVCRRSPTAVLITWFLFRLQLQMRVMYVTMTLKTDKVLEWNEILQTTKSWFLSLWSWYFQKFHPCWTFFATHNLHPRPTFSGDAESCVGRYESHSAWKSVTCVWPSCRRSNPFSGDTIFFLPCMRV